MASLKAFVAGAMASLKAFIAGAMASLKVFRASGDALPYASLQSIIVSPSRPLTWSPPHSTKTHRLRRRCESETAPAAVGTKGCRTAEKSSAIKKTRMTKKLDPTGYLLIHKNEKNSFRQSAF